MAKQIASYNEDSIKSLDWKEHIRMRPGMYIGKLGDGSAFFYSRNQMIFQKLRTGRFNEALNHFCLPAAFRLKI